MADRREGRRTVTAAAQGWFDGVRPWWQRARETPGYERQTLLMVLKGTLAASLAWLVSYDVIGAQSPAFAPFSAVLIMQVTVYQSLLQSLRYLAAVTAGVAMVAVLGLMAGSDLLTFVLVALVALAIGRRPSLGSQGPQVATAAFTQVLGGLDEDSLADQSRQLCHLAEEAQGRCRSVTGCASRAGLPLADPARPYGVLVVESARLMEEFQHVCDVLQRHVVEEV